MSRLPEHGAARLLLTAVATALAVACAEPERPGELRSRLDLADSLHREGRWQDAARAYGAIGDSLAAAGDTAALWRAAAHRADALTRLGRTESAFAEHQRALVLAGDDPTRQARTRYFLSIWYDRQGRFPEAEEEARRTLELGRSGARGAQRDALNALGRIYSLTGRYREALDVHERYLALMREAGTPGEVALALNEIGIDYRHFGRFDDAARSYEEALAIFRDVGDARRVALVQYNLANIRFDTGDLAGAARLYRESLETNRKIGNLRGEGFALNALGETYLEAGNLEAARSNFLEAVAVNRRARYAYGLVAGLLGTGNTALAAGRAEAAAEPLTVALSLADSAGLARERAAAHVALSRLAVRSGDGPRARTQAELALAIADSLRDPAARHEALAALGPALEAVGRQEDALDVYVEGIDLLESWRGRLALGDLRLGVARPRLDVYEGAIRILVRRDRGTEAFHVGERARARLLLELMADHAASADSTATEARLRRSLRDVYAARAGAPPEERPGLDRKIARIGASMAALEAEAREAEPTTGPARRPSPVSSRAVQSGLGEDHALLAYFWGEEGVYGWLVSRRAVEAARLGSTDSLAALVGFLRAVVEDGATGPGWRAAARRAHAELVAPLVRRTFPTGRLPESLWVIPDGPLASLPFEVLVPHGRAAGEEASDVGEPWALTHLITYGPSASILLSLADAPRQDEWEGEILAVANPGGRDEAGLPPLPHATIEARRVVGAFRPDRAAILVGEAATMGRWRDHGPERYRYLHFATHAVVSDRRPEETYLLFSDGRLGLSAIRATRLRAELVTLSACETGLGLRVRGEGLVGLPHAFLAAGAGGVVVTLWRVTDRSAAEFMARFYRELRSGSEPARAIRAVRRWMVGRGGADAHPARWAPYVLVGGGAAPG